MPRIVAVIITIALISTLAIKIYSSSKENQAIKIAKEYLTQKYEQEMRYENIRFSWIDPSLYHVRFSPDKYPEIVFEVLVQRNLTISENMSEFGQNNRSADNYYIKYFEYLIENYFLEDVKRLWGSDADIRVLQINIGLYSFAMPSELNDKMPLATMEALMNNYWIYIKTKDVILDGHILGEVGDRIFEFIQIIQTNGFNPETINFWYPISKNKTINIHFNNLNEINSVSQVIEKLEGELIQ